VNTYYVSLTAKLPRKRTEQRFEARMTGSDHIEAKRLATDLITTHKLREVRGVAMQLWNISELPFVDSDGVNQVIVMRSIFPSGSAIAVQL
jgi:hypothetical protein